MRPSFTPPEVHSPEPNPDYGFSQGLSMVVSEYGSDGTCQKNTKHLDRAAIPVTDPSYESWCRTRQALDKPRKEGGLGFTVVAPRPGEDNGTLLLYHYPWGSRPGNPVGAVELAMMAREIPDATILAVDSPATGRSDATPRTIAKEIARTGSHIPYGAFAVNALRSVLPDYDRYVLAGGSLGARRAAGLAAAWRQEGDLTNPAVLSMNDPPGDHRQTLSHLTNAFARTEARHTMRYTAASPDGLAMREQQRGDSPPHMIRSLASLAIRGGLTTQLFREPQSMARAGLEDDLRAALPQITDRLVVATPAMSELTDVDCTREILERLAHHPDRDINTKIVHAVIPDHTHSIQAGCPGVITEMLRI